MRKLAQALGVEAMSLYNHVANKGDLVGGIVDLVVSEFELPEGGEDWESGDPAVCDLRARRARAPPLGVQPRALAEREPRLPTPRACATSSGCSDGCATPASPPEQAYHGYHALDSHILGFTLWQLGHTAGTEDRDLDELATTFLSELPAGEFPYLVEHVHQHLAAGNDGTERVRVRPRPDPEGLKERSTTAEPAVRREWRLCRRSQAQALPAGPQSGSRRGERRDPEMGAGGFEPP